MPRGGKEIRFTIKENKTLLQRNFSESGREERLPCGMERGQGERNITDSEVVKIDFAGKVRKRRFLGNRTAEEFSVRVKLYKKRAARKICRRGKIRVDQSGLRPDSV